MTIQLPALACRASFIATIAAVLAVATVRKYRHVDVSAVEAAA